MTKIKYNCKVVTRNPDVPQKALSELVVTFYVIGGNLKKRSCKSIQ